MAFAGLFDSFVGYINSQLIVPVLNEMSIVELKRNNLM